MPTGDARVRVSWFNGPAVLAIDLRDAALLAGDVNADGLVNVDDLVLVISSWGACPIPPADCPGDADGDGIVDVADLVTVIMDWGG